MTESRVHKSFLNIRVNMFFYLLSFFFAFVSRKVFLNYLSAEFIGLTGTLGNILSFLNLAEFGLNTSITFFLYEPLVKKDIKKINEIISVLGYIYRKIGIFIGITGIIISLFFPFIFAKSALSFLFIYFTYFSFLGSSLTGYFINYKQIILSADQKNYIINSYLQTAVYIKTIIQIFLTYYYKNLYLWISIEFIYSVIVCIFINKKIKKIYPWINTNISNGKYLLKEYPDIYIKSRQVFIHKIKDFFLYRSDQILVFTFTSLKMVAYFDNYSMIINKIIILINTLSDGLGAGVGNLVAEKNDDKIMSVYWELNSFRLWITGIIIFGLFHFISPFISIWLGNEYILSDIILILMLINLYIMLSRGTTEMYISAYGLYKDTYVAWIELVINITVTIIAASYLGIAGILLGKIISVIGIALVWKPYFLFKYGIKKHFSIYWKEIIKQYILFISLFVVFYPIKYLIQKNVTNVFSLVLYAFFFISLFSIIYFILMYIFTKGLSNLINRFPFIQKLLLLKK